MPKPRSNVGARKCRKIIYIVCEGSKDKSEYAYFKGLLNDCSFKNTIEIKPKETKKNTGKELVSFAHDLVEKKFRSIDEAWVVYDKDGYTKHPETFSLAKNKKVKIAFSSISFETWILMHFEYTSKAFDKSDSIISYIEKKFHFEYKKNDICTYEKIKEFRAVAIFNAKKLNQYEVDGNPFGTPIYELNPYTDIYKLVEEILSLQISNN